MSHFADIFALFHHLEIWEMALLDAVGENCKKGATTDIKELYTIEAICSMWTIRLVFLISF